MENQQHDNQMCEKHFSGEHKIILKNSSSASQQGILPLNSNVVEVTGNGAIGFVAIGRPVSQKITNEQIPSFDGNMVKKQRSPKRNHSFITRIRWKNTADLEDINEMPDMNLQLSYRRSSAPTVNNVARNDLSVFKRYSNTPVLAGDGCNYLKTPQETDGQTVAKTKKPKKQHSGKDTCFTNIDLPKISTGGIVPKQGEEFSSQQPDSPDKENSSSRSLHTEKQVSLKKSHSFVHSYPLCKQCGQRHRLSENHEFDYVQEADDDLQCDICLQPFIDPYDTKCGHTFCCTCLKNYVRIKKTCPVDRKDLDFISSDCWKASLAMRKLVDKLLVHCPNVNHCTKTLPRSDLTAHLKERCPGTILRCKYEAYGCDFRGAREEQRKHAGKCTFQHVQRDPVLKTYPDCVEHVVELFRPEGFEELGIAIVGGNDTPVKYIVVQEIFPNSLASMAGRLMTGDILINVNGEDMHNVSHVEARTILSRPSRLMRFTLMRDRGVEAKASQGNVETISQRITVSLLKPPSDQLGIKISQYDDGTPGIYILDLVPGYVAALDGQLQVGDRILEISHVTLWDESPETAARVIQSSGTRLEIVVSRQVRQNSASIKNSCATDKTLTRGTFTQSVRQNAVKDKQEEALTISFEEVNNMSVSFTEKIINVKKSANESLGIIVAGGLTGSRGDLPVYVQDVQPFSVLGKDKRVERGDLLVEVNGVSLTGLTHSQAMGLLKETAQYRKDVSLTALELNYDGKEEDFALWEELSCVHRQLGKRTSQSDASCCMSWMPSWKMWLAVPHQCRIPRDVVMKKSNRSGLGFSIIGGRVEAGGVATPIFIKYVVSNSPAALQGLKCGDELVAVSGREVSTMTHSSVVQALKSASPTIILTIMSWPGSVH